MKRLVSWFAINPVATNLLVAFVLFAGVASFTRIPVQIWPDLNVPVISIAVPYLGAAPEEVETAVCARIDEKLDGIDGIDRVLSTAEEGRCRVRVVLHFDADRASVLADVQNQVNAIDTLPKETETPVVRLVSSSDVVIEVAVTGPTDERTLKELARRVRNDLLSLPAVTRASVANVRPYEISIEVSEASLQRNQLTFDQVANAIRSNSLDLPGGTIRTDRGELLLRTQGQADRGEEFRRIEVTTRDDGTRVLLEDVARVVDGFADTGQEFRFDGRPAALVRVSQVGSQDLREISAQVRRYVAESGARYPEDVMLTVWNDQSSLLVDRLATLIDSGLQGLLLVLVVLALFLRPHLALWVSAGIPIALLGAVFLLFCFGVSIDAISLIGFILVLGLLVDDAVVVGESAYVAQREGAGRLAGAIEGARRVFVPVTFGVLTTVAAFVPMLFLTGVAGQFMAAIAAPVICCLVFSLIECHVILPLHLGHRSDSMPLGEFGIALLAVAVLAAVVLATDLGDAIGLTIGVACLVVAAHLSGALRWLGAAFARLQVRFEHGLETFIQGTFRRVVRRVLERRALTVTSGVVALGLAVAVVVGGHLPFSFLISDQGDRIVAKLTMPFGVPRHDTDQALARLTASAQGLQVELARRIRNPHHHAHSRIARLAPAGWDVRPGHDPPPEATSARSTCSCRLRRSARDYDRRSGRRVAYCDRADRRCRAACLCDRLQAVDPRHRHPAIRGQHGRLARRFRRCGGRTAQLPGRARGFCLVQSREGGAFAIAHRRRRRAWTHPLGRGAAGQASLLRRGGAARPARRGRPARDGSLPGPGAAFAWLPGVAPRPHA